MRNKCLKCLSDGSYCQCPAEPANEMEKHRFARDTYYVVPPKNTTRIVVSEHSSKVYYSSIEDLDYTDPEKPRWVHRPGSAHGNIAHDDAYERAERLWEAEKKGET